MAFEGCSGLGASRCYLLSSIFFTCHALLNMSVKLICDCNSFEIGVVFLTKYYSQIDSHCLSVSRFLTTS